MGWLSRKSSTDRSAPADRAKPNIVRFVLTRLDRSLLPKYCPMRMLPPVVIPMIIWVKIIIT